MRRSFILSLCACAILAFSTACEDMEDLEPLLQEVAAERAGISIRTEGALDETKKPLVLIYKKGDHLTEAKLAHLDPKDIKSIHVFKGKSATELYGAEAADGVIRIEMK